MAIQIMAQPCLLVLVLILSICCGFHKDLIKHNIDVIWLENK